MELGFPAGQGSSGARTPRARRPGGQFWRKAGSGPLLWAVKVAWPGGLSGRGTARGKKKAPERQVKSPLAEPAKGPGGCVPAPVTALKTPCNGKEPVHFLSGGLLPLPLSPPLPLFLLWPLSLFSSFSPARPAAPTPHPSTFPGSFLRA